MASASSGRHERARRREDVAALDGRALHPLEIHRGALSGLGALDGLAVDLEAAHLGLDATRIDLDPVVDGERARRRACP